ncbi:MAG: hypothetical protein AABY91_09695, partial [Gemmatimonadota bacterium]
MGDETRRVYPDGDRDKSAGNVAQRERLPVTSYRLPATGYRLPPSRCRLNASFFRAVQPMSLSRRNFIKGVIAGGMLPKMEACLAA